MRPSTKLSLVLALSANLAGCPDPPSSGGQPVAGAAATADILIENVAGYTWREDSLHRFGALRIGADGAVVATYEPGDIPASTSLQRIDGRGATLLPGLIDAHGHVESLGLARTRVDLVGTRSLDEALARVAVYAEAHPESPWILGRGWNQVLWTERRFPTAADLDRLGLERPVWLTRIDGHAAWGNSRALELAGIDATTPDPDGGRILRDDDGNATGIFIDAAESLVEAVIPPPSREVRRRALRAALDELASLGLTSVHDAGIDNELAGVYRELAAEGAMPVRVYAMLSEDSYARFGDPLPDDGTGFLAIRSIKVYLDGALGSRGAALLSAYSDEPGNTGLLFRNADSFAGLAHAAASRGFQVNVHAIGDAANRAALDGFERIDSRVLRHRIEHAQIIAPGDIERFAALGVIASMQPIHATSDMNMAEDRVGAQRMGGGYAWRSLLDSGAVIASGSDFPVEPANPFHGLYAAITRQDQAGLPAGGWYAAERMTRAEALRTFTHDAAYAAHQEERIGTLEPGKRADFILVDRDLFEVPAAQIWQTVVLETWVDGNNVYKRR